MTRHLRSTEAGRGHEGPKQQIYPREDGECIAETNESSSGSVFHPGGCFQFCSLPTLVGSRSRSASCATSPRKNRGEKRDRTANEKKERCPRARFAPSRRRIQLSFPPTINLAWLPCVRPQPFVSTAESCQVAGIVARIMLYDFATQIES